MGNLSNLHSNWSYFSVISTPVTLKSWGFCHLKLKFFQGPLLGCKLKQRLENHWFLACFTGGKLYDSVPYTQAEEMLTARMVQLKPVMLVIFFVSVEYKTRQMWCITHAAWSWLPPWWSYNSFDNRVNDLQWGLFIKMATGCESRRWGTLSDQRPGRGHSDQWLCRQHERRVRPARQLSFTAEVCANDPSMWTPNILRSFYEERGLNNRQNLSSELGRLACRYRSSILIAGPGIVLLYMYSEPRELSLVLSAVQHFTSFAFLSFFFLYFSPLQ